MAAGVAATVIGKEAKHPAIVYFTVGVPATPPAVTVAVPAVVPVTVADPAGAIDHVPPVVASTNDAVVPKQIADGPPVMGGGVVLTVIVAVVEQPAGVR